MKYELVLESTKDVAHGKFSIYKIGGYTVSRMDYTAGAICMNIREERDWSLPTIYCQTNPDGDVLTGFNIQTASFGALSPDDIRKLIAGYNEALEVVAILTKEFIEKEN